MPKTAVKKKSSRKPRPKYMLVEIDWPLKDIKAAAGDKGLSVAKFARQQVKAGVERYITRQNRLFSD